MPNHKSKVASIVLSALAEKPRTMKELETLTGKRQRTIHLAFRSIGNILTVQAGKQTTYELSK